MPASPRDTNIELHEVLQELLRELTKGPQDEYGLFSEAGAGLLPTLDAATAAQVSFPVAPSRPSLAAYTAHLTQSLHFAVDVLRGGEELPDFAAAWRVTDVDEAAWQAQREDLRAALYALQQATAQIHSFDSKTLRTVLGALVHTAYHVGALRITLRNLHARV